LVQSGVGEFDVVGDPLGGVAVAKASIAGGEVYGAAIGGNDITKNLPVSLYSTRDRN